MAAELRGALAEAEHGADAARAARREAEQAAEAARARAARLGSELATVSQFVRGSSELPEVCARWPRASTWSPATSSRWPRRWGRA